MFISENSYCHTKQLRIFFFLLLQLTFGCTNMLYAFQMPLRNKPIRVGIAHLITIDTGVKKTPTFLKKNFKAATTQLLLGEIVPWTFDKYVAKMQYASISMESTNYNLNLNSWTWDDDDFGTNQFGHPYHGSAFYSAFRVNGYSFWQSAPAAFAGSYIWETFAENQAPSINDFINTGFGGVILGEMSFRLSKMIVNNHTRGFKRQASEVLAFLINPMNGFKRIVDHKWGKVGNNSAQFDSSKIYAEFDIGLRQFNANKTGTAMVYYGHVKLLYGNPFENYRKPFSNISINMELSNDDSSKLNTLNVYGTLTGWFIGKSTKNTHLLILSTNYDFLQNQAFLYSAESIKLNLFSNIQVVKKIKMNSIIGLGAIFLAAVPDAYGYQNRNYAFGCGLATNASIGLQLFNKISVNANYKGSLIKTLNGNPAHYFLHIITAEAQYKLLNHIGICFEPGYFKLYGHYKYLPDVNETYPYFRFSVRYAAQGK
ncbi:MAG: DUF3943 domain-containing protein [Sediminibacterium sp.]